MNKCYNYKQSSSPGTTMCETVSKPAKTVHICTHVQATSNCVMLFLNFGQAGTELHNDHGMNIVIDYQHCRKHGHLAV